MAHPERLSYLTPEFALSKLEVVFVAGNKGFCEGVKRAIDMTWTMHMLNREENGEKAVTVGVHQIVHNDVVSDAFDKHGVKFIDKFDPQDPLLLELTQKGIKPWLVFSAHGSSPQEVELAARQGYRLVDAVCPLVIRVANEVHAYTKRGAEVIYLATKGHREALGIQSINPQMVHLVNLKDGANPQDALNLLSDMRSRGVKDIIVLSQTTLSAADTEETKEAIRKSDPEVKIINDLCYATTNRQAAVIEAIQTYGADYVLAVGDQKSKNTAMLVVAANRVGIKGQRVNSPSEINLQSILGAKKLLITSGASVPDEQLKYVIDWVEDCTFGKIDVIELDPVQDETDKSFKLPEDLRNIYDKYKSSPNKLVYKVG